MFVLPEVRGRGFAQSILRDLEQWGVESGFSFSVLETLGRRKLLVCIRNVDIQ
jgi:GNAT superfamily N-acetyltransferase